MDGKLLHHVRYRRRRAVVDVWNWFGGGKRFEASDWSKEFADGLLSYANRCCSFGGWRRLKRYVRGKPTVPVKRCVVCGEAMIKLPFVWTLPDGCGVIKLNKSRPLFIPGPPIPPPPGSLLNWMEVA
jgi:hypothetical protein